MDDDIGSSRPEFTSSEGSSSGSAAPEQSDLLTITIEANTGHIVKIERADGPGRCHELSEAETADLEKNKSKETLEGVIEQAFESGIVSVLGGAADPGSTAESEQEADVRHLLLSDLIKSVGAQRLMNSDVLNRAFIGTAIRQAGTHINSRRENQSG